GRDQLSRGQDGGAAGREGGGVAPGPPRSAGTHLGWFTVSERRAKRHPFPAAACRRCRKKRPLFRQRKQPGKQRRGRAYLVSPAPLRAAWMSASLAPPLSSSLTLIASFSTVEALASTPLTLASASWAFLASASLAADTTRVADGAPTSPRWGVSAPAAAFAR